MADTGRSEVIRTLACTTAVFAVIAANAAAQVPQMQVPCEQITSIGVATMAADGTITLRVHTLPPGPIGHGMLEYRPDHPQYREIIRHLGGLAPGETKSVPPWC